MWERNNWDFIQMPGSARNKAFYYSYPLNNDLTKILNSVPAVAFAILMV